jgi:glycosyltransferase involved in cell wall biosynthesis
LDLLYALRVIKTLPAADVLITNTIWLPVLVRNSKRGKLYVHIARYPKGQMRFYRHAARLQTVSNPVADAIKKELPGEARKIIAIHPFLINNPPAIDFESAWKARGQTLLYVGRIHPEKGVDLLLKAFGKLVLSHELAWRLRIVGPTRVNMGGGGDAYLSKLKTISEPFAEKVEWFGFVSPEQLNQLYCESSIFVYPSVAERGETFGAAPLEAMSLGCPAIVSNLKCFSDFITDGKTGFVFNHRVTEPENELARRLFDAIGDAGRLKMVAKAAYETTEAFKIERITDQYLEDFDKVIRERIPN